MVYKSLNGLAPHTCATSSKNATLCSHSLCNTKTTLTLSLKRTGNRQKCFSYRGAKIWNSLSTESKQAPSMNISKQTFNFSRIFNIVV